MNHRLFAANRVFWGGAAAALLACVSVADGRTIRYVDADAIGAGSGTSWANAYTDLQDGLDHAVRGDEIWVANGSYLPSLRADPANSRTATFRLIDGVAVFGGFAGFETNPDQRDWAAYPTILSGDLNGDDGPDFTHRMDNAYHVAIGSDTDSSTVLDGVVVVGGNASAIASDNQFGGGLMAEGGSLTIRNCTFSENTGWLGAGMALGGVHHLSGQPTLVNCVFWNNRTTLSGDGGGLYILPGCDPLLIDCRFIENGAGEAGGGVIQLSDEPSTFINCVFLGNQAGRDDVIDDLSLGGGAMAGGDSLFVNCLFAGNRAYGEAGLVQGAAISVGGSAELINCTIAGNVSDGVGGGVLVEAADVVLTNCVLWGNADWGGSITDETAQIGEAAWGNSGIAVNYSCVQGWTGTLGGSGNHGVYPRFLQTPGEDYGDLRLSPGSPCIDAGDSTALPPDWGDLDDDGDPWEATPLDLDLNARVADDPNVPDVGLPDASGIVVDMGAYEGAGACDSGPCSDGDPCTVNDLCNDGICSGTLVDGCVDCLTNADCNDGVACTDNECLDGECTFSADDSLCPEDESFCNGVRVCDPRSGCVDTGSPCANGLVCDEATLSCVPCLSDEDCDDGLFCTGPEACDAEAGCVSGRSPCPSGTRCDEAADTCQECTADYNCDDGIDCTIDSCESGRCSFHPDNDYCPGDGFFCNGAEVCDVDLGCVSTGDPCPFDTTCNESLARCDQCTIHADCDDGKDCTDEACIEGQCDVTPDDDACPDDGVYCNGTEFCDVRQGCVSAGNPCSAAQVCDEVNAMCGSCLADSECDDEIACTLNACIDGECVAIPDDGLCVDDGVFCNGEEICDQQAGCVSAGIPCPPVLACDESDRRCVVCVDDLDCNDGDLCTLDQCVDHECAHTTSTGCGPDGYVSRDEDNDGVLNWDDRCPHTLPDTLVDGYGCPLEPPSAVAGKSEWRYPIDGDSGASVGRGAGGACGAMGLVSVGFLFAGLRLLRCPQRRRPRTSHVELGIPRPFCTPSQCKYRAGRNRSAGQRSHIPS